MVVMVMVIIGTVVVGTVSAHPRNLLGRINKCQRTREYMFVYTTNSA